MYETFFGLAGTPFSLTSDPAYLFLTQQHREALAGLAYAIFARKGLIVFTGNAGTGKTTLLRKVLQELPAKRLRSNLILNPTLAPSEFIEMLLLQFGISNVPTSKAQRMWLLERLLTESRGNDQLVAVIIDEAHKLSPDTLEEIRLLSNFETASEKLVQIVLSGQPELASLLNEVNLFQLKQRISLRLSLHALASAEVPGYVRHRWKIAGAVGELPFTAEGLDLVAYYSQGIPRLINAICDNALTTALSREQRTVQAADVRAAIRDLDLSPEDSHTIRAQPTLVSWPLNENRVQGGDR
jgi:general secretion pathway protein A